MTGIAVSTTESGDRFRDQVAALLRAGGFTAETEILEGHKRVDIVFVQVTFGKRRRYVVEAKNWSEPLNKTALETIYGGYSALINSRAADELLIVSPHALKSPAAKAFVRDTPNIAHLSFNEFQESILGFHDYLSKFVSQHERGGLEDYYVSPLIDNAVSLETTVDDWLTGADRHPIAIIASYGMGKTSFAQHVTYKLAKRFLKGEPCRVPILVSLGVISREQSLEGLIGTALAGTHPAVQGYKFPLFAHLNAIGRFVILLDGFDEMKHMMTQAEFVANFDELNKLVDGEAKVLILGRPTAFLSDNERLSVLRGTKPVGSTRVRTPGAPKYTEISLLPFSLPQLKSFVRDYLARHRRLGNITIGDDLMLRREREIEDKANEDLISRPIHARMMADLATDPDFDMAGLSRFALYDHFVDHLVGRELQKSGRGKLYKANDRRSFACDLAWHLWTAHSSSGLGCRIDDLPDSLFRPYIPGGEEINSAKRDLLSGSFLDEKKGGVFFFSHRSFQEFLVAEYIWSALVDGDAQELDDIYSIIHALSQEIFDFLCERADEQFFRALLSALSKCKVGIPVDKFNVICTSVIMRDTAARRSRALFSTWDAAILIGNAIAAPEERRSSDEFVRLAKTIAEKADRKPTVILVSMRAYLALSLQRKIPQETIVPALIVLLFSRSETDLRSMAVTSDSRSRNDTFRDLIFEIVSAEQSDNGAELTMRLDVSEMFSSLGAITSLPVDDKALDQAQLTPYIAPFADFFKDIPAGRHKAIRAFFEKDADATARAMQQRDPNEDRQS